MSSDTDLAWRLEEELLQPEVRRDASRLDDLLGPGFREIGASGRLAERGEVVDVLTRESGTVGPFEISERHAEELDGGYVLLTFRLQSGDRASWRSSLWQVTGYGAKLVFHQGTPIPG